MVGGPQTELGPQHPGNYLWVAECTIAVVSQPLVGSSLAGDLSGQDLGNSRFHGGIYEKVLQTRCNGLL